MKPFNQILSWIIVTSILIACSGSAIAAELKGSDLRKHKQFISEYPIVTDPALNAYVTRIGERVLAASPHAGRDYQFVIRDNPQANAFVAGYDVVYIERGLITLMNSEAELAAVIAHEIGHNVGQHVKKRVARRARSNVLAFLSSVLVGNSSLGNAVMTEATINEYEYTREAELEADRFSADYLYGANYEPSQLVGALSQINDYVNFTTNLEGIELPHHGLGSTHPRSDKRLRKVVAAAGELPPGEADIGRDAYREAITGVIYGPNYANVAPEGYERYSNERLGITLLYPDTWTLQIKGAKLIFKDAEKTAQMKISIEKTGNKTQSSEEAIKEKFPDIVNAEPIHKETQRDFGTLGAVPAKRLALSMVGRNTYVFEGIAKDNQITAEQDAVFVELIRSFRRMTRDDRTGEEVTKIYFRRLEPGETFSTLAQSTGIDADLVENELRILNGYYPKGEPEPGTWIKMLRKEKVQKKKPVTESQIEQSEAGS